jgi:hypothetical protein
MLVQEWYYLFVAALVNSCLQFFWMTKIANKSVQGVKVYSVIFIGSLLSAWGIDVLQRMLDIFTIVHILKIALGCWLMFAAATASKHYAVNHQSIKQFWLDYGGDLVGFLVMGLIIYALT